MKLLKIKEETHQAFKMYCVANKIDMQDQADKIITNFLLKEAGGTQNDTK